MVIGMKLQQRRYCVKKLTVFLFVAVLIVGTVSAQTRDNRAPEQRRLPERPEIKSTTIEGTLKLERGMIALESNNTVYHVPVLNRYIGFIDGLKEGATASVEGYLFRGFILPSKVTIAGKSYDFYTRGGTRENPGRQNVKPDSENARPERKNLAPNQSLKGFRHGMARGNFGHRNFFPKMNRGNFDRKNFAPGRNFGPNFDPERFGKHRRLQDDTNSQN